MCASQATTLDAQLTNYTVYFVRSGTAKCSNGQPYGNAVVARSGSTRLAFTTYQLPNRSGLQARSMVCARMTSPAIEVCATHLVNGTSSRSAPRSRSRCPPSSGATSIPARRRMNWTSWVATRGNVKLDYGWASARFALGGESVVDSPHSDHHQLWAKLSL